SLIYLHVLLTGFNSISFLLYELILLYVRYQMLLHFRCLSFQVGEQLPSSSVACEREFMWRKRVRCAFCVIIFNCSVSLCSNNEGTFLRATGQLQSSTHPWSGQTPPYSFSPSHICQIMRRGRPPSLAR